MYSFHCLNGCLRTAFLIRLCFTKWLSNRINFHVILSFPVEICIALDILSSFFVLRDTRSVSTSGGVLKSGVGSGRVWIIPED